jgi:hypothetical protein
MAPTRSGDRDPADRHAAHRRLSDAGDERCQGRIGPIASGLVLDDLARYAP